MIYRFPIQHKATFTHHNFTCGMDGSRVVGFGGIVGDGGNAKGGDADANKEIHEAFAGLNEV